MIHYRQRRRSEITTICLVRHGETEWNAQGIIQGQMDIPLNARGIQQAEECAVHLREEKYDVLITSPLRRAKQTAEIINRNWHIPLVEMDDFLERYFGEAQGMTKEERLSKYPDKNYPNLESRDSVKSRVMTGLHKITQNYPDKYVLLVAHGAVINSILATLSNGEIGSGKTKLINACISNITFAQDRWSVQAYNQISHLSVYGERS